MQWFKSLDPYRWGIGIAFVLILVAGYNLNIHLAEKRGKAEAVEENKKKINKIIIKQEKESIKNERDVSKLGYDELLERVLSDSRPDSNMSETIRIDTVQQILSSEYGQEDSTGSRAEKEEFQNTYGFMCTEEQVMQCEPERCCNEE